MEKDRAISRREWATLTAGGALALPLFGQGHPEVTPLPASHHTPWTEPSVFRRVTLEMSLKPFRHVDSAGIRSVCEHVFRQWAPLLARADGCAVMLWTADGSEILDYRGRMSDEIEWARYIGIVNPPRMPPKTDPANINIHQQARFYMENPPRITYGTLREIVQTFQSVGRSMTGKPVVVGATFDPGPEFARSPFKYEKHSEILKGQWVDCSSTLNADAEPFAGFPRGIPARTPFGTFFGRQVQQFLTDLGFQYIWFSNGFGFSVTAWSVKGALFDGEKFHPEKAGEFRDKILAFWKAFRVECPSFPVECRGSNLSTGADLSSGGSPLKYIYDGGFNLVAPPNSPWAAIDGDFGLEISGYLSHIAHLPPGDVFPFRFYTHDPWWLNSPWFDRYGREPHDIYMPLALARMNGQGKVTPPSYLEFLTIDNSYGEIPDECPNEVTPHILSAMDHFSDAPGLLTWVYPFDEFHEKVFGSSPRTAEVFFSDWFMRNAVNAGLPLNTVVSTANFLASRNTNPPAYHETILLTPVPDPGTPLESALLDHLNAGGNVFLYGPATHASPKLLDLLHLRIAPPLTGELELRSQLPGDTLHHGSFAARMLHRDAPSGGGIDTAAAQPADASVEICATVSGGSNERVFAVTRQVGSGRLAWVRGSFSSRITNAALPQPDDPGALFQAEYLMRYMLGRFGYELHVEKPTIETRNPLMLVARSNNGFFFSGYCPSTAVSFRLRFPHGAPILLGYETWLENGRASYSMPRAWHRECRCFVEQAGESELSCVEGISEEIGIRRRMLLKGLKGATVHFYPELLPAGTRTRMDVNNRRITYSAEDSGRRLVARDVTGELRVSW